MYLNTTMAVCPLESGGSPMAVWIFLWAKGGKGREGDI